MKFKIQTTPGKSPSTLIVPIAKGDQFNQTIKAIAAEFGIPAKRLGADFQAKAGQQYVLYSTNGERMYLLGLGETPTFPKVLDIWKKWAFNLRSELSEKITISLAYGNAPEEPSLLSEWVEGMINGLLLARYDIGIYKTDKKEEQGGFMVNRATGIVIVDEEMTDIALAAIVRSQAIAATQLRIFDLVNAPGNKVKAETLATWAKASGKANAFTVNVLNKVQCEKAGLQALLAVNRGSEWPPAFIIMEYLPKRAGKKKFPTIGLVGKGVTFDTGGISLKDSPNMHYMKSDMGGAAAVLGAMEVCAKLQLPIHLIGIVPATDNCIDATAVKPGDVIGSYSGKTIEIIDTDAEGRLILADGLAYMSSNFKPEVMIDLATLTGSTVRTLGYHAGAIFSNNDELVNQLNEAGEQSGERLWRLPLWDDYKEDIESDVADVRNFSGKPIAGAISAAKFLEVFTNDHPAWAHLDIAGVAFGNSILSKQKSATGFGIRLLIAFLENWKVAKK